MERRSEQSLDSLLWNVKKKEEIANVCHRNSADSYFRCYGVSEEDFLH